MKKEIADLWIEWLEDENNKQAHRKLKDGGGRCCLGGLCDLYMKYNPGVAKWRDDDFEYLDYRDVQCHSTFLPPEVQLWAGMKTDRGMYDDSTDLHRNTKQLFLDNDGQCQHEDIPEVKQKSFKEIAQIIRENWEKL